MFVRKVSTYVSALGQLLSFPGYIDIESMEAFHRERHLFVNTSPCGRSNRRLVSQSILLFLPPKKLVNNFNENDVDECNWCQFVNESYSVPVVIVRLRYWAISRYGRDSYHANFGECTCYGLGDQPWLNWTRRLRTYTNLTRFTSPLVLNGVSGCYLSLAGWPWRTWSWTCTDCENSFRQGFDSI